jgi:hypothetical protein
VAESESFGPLTVACDDGGEPNVSSRNSHESLSVKICREARADDAHVQGCFQGDPFDR